MCGRAAEAAAGLRSVGTWSQQIPAHATTRPNAVSASNGSLKCLTSRAIDDRTITLRLREAGRGIHLQILYSGYVSSKNCLHSRDLIGYLLASADV
jgi:hypothetical protein